MVNLILEWPTTMKLLNVMIMLKLFKKRFSIWILQQGGCMILQFMNRSSEAQVTSFGRINVRFKITQDKNMIISKGGVRKKKKDNFVILFEFVKIHLLKQKNITAHA